MSEGQPNAVARRAWVSPWERETRRHAILEAAGRVAARQGIEALTLAAVAEEAGIARGTLYGYFSGKRDLLAQLGPVTPQPRVEVSTAVSEARPAAGEVDFEAAQSKQAGELDRLAKRILVPKSLLKGGTDAAIASLETRLGVIEKSYAESERRADRAAKDVGARIEAVAGTVAEIKERCEAFENKQQWALAEIRLEIHNLSQAKPEPVRVTPSGETSNAPESHEPAPLLEPAPDAATAEPRTEAYLSSARRAAKLAAAKENYATRDAAAKRQRLRSWLVGAAVLVTAVACALLYLHTSGTTHAHATPVRAAARSNARGEFILGLQLMHGTDRPIALDAGARLVERAAKDGEPVAQEYLAMLYRTGTGVAADMAKAVQWDLAAARQGNVEAMAELGKAYAGSWPSNTDYGKAAYWFEQAAHYGNIDAAFDLAVLYERGAGVRQSESAALTWYAIAGKEGDAGAAARARELTADLAPQTLVTAQKVATSFRALTPKKAAN